ncbi:MAG: hypothetical protein A2007_06255 [Verrucomicrobia bacterium GWC2_42_7]|nr:MAG: hypothetical protein A2007_06255 [Verrucomicrobia bacterium GWC2_42_7]
MKKWLLVLLGWMWSLSVWGSFPVMHAYLACIWLESHCTNYSQEDKVAFMCGTLFPDIYHVGVFDRTKTHDSHVNLQDVAACKSPFLSGVKLHSFVDNERIKFSSKYKTEKFFPADVPEREYGLMVLEDQCIKPKMDQKFKSHNWLKRKYDINKEEYAYKASKRYLSFWHYFVYRYFVSEPQDTIQYMYYCSFVTLACPNSHSVRFFVSLGRCSPIVKKQIKEQRQDVENYVNALVSHFQTLFDGSER